jgi:uncharacterized membrane protein
MWYLFSVISALFILCYPIGIPGVLSYMLYKRRFRLHWHPLVKAEFGFLYVGYKHGHWWFELVDVFHRLLTCSILAFIPREHQLPVAMCLFTLYLVIILYQSPWVRSSDDLIHRLIQTELLLFAMIGWIFYSLPYSATFDEDTDLLVGILMIFIILAMAALFVFFIVMSIKMICCNKKKDKQADQRVMKQSTLVEKQKQKASEAHTEEAGFAD